MGRRITLHLIRKHGDSSIAISRTGINQKILAETLRGQSADLIIVNGEMKEFELLQTLQLVVGGEQGKIISIEGKEIA